MNITQTHNRLLERPPFLFSAYAWAYISCGVGAFNMQAGSMLAAPSATDATDAWLTVAESSVVYGAVLLYLLRY